MKDKITNVHVDFRKLKPGDIGFYYCNENVFSYVIYKFFKFLFPKRIKTSYPNLKGVFIYLGNFLIFDIYNSRPMLIDLRKAKKIKKCVFKRNKFFESDYVVLLFKEVAGKLHYGNKYKKGFFKRIFYFMFNTLACYFFYYNLDVYRMSNIVYEIYYKLDLIEFIDKKQILPDDIFNHKDFINVNF